MIVPLSACCVQSNKVKASFSCLLLHETPQLYLNRSSFKYFPHKYFGYFCFINPVNPISNQDIKLKGRILIGILCKPAVLIIPLIAFFSKVLSCKIIKDNRSKIEVESEMKT